MSAHPKILTPVLIGGCIIIMIGFSIRASVGVFQIPIAEDYGWPRSDFSLAIAAPLFVAGRRRWVDLPRSQ